MSEVKFDDFEDVINFLKEKFIGKKTNSGSNNNGKKSFKRKFNLIIVVIFLLFLGSGIYQVGPDEQAAVLRFGKYVKTVGPGMHWYFPSPIGKRYVMKTTKIYRVEIGFKTLDIGPPARYQDLPKESLMFTGDENLINVNVSIQYRINSLKDYLFNVKTQKATIKSAGESSIRQVVASKDIEETLTIGKESIQDETRQKLQEILNNYGIGVTIIGVQLQDVGPPGEVMKAFKDVANAREDKSRYINEADGYKNNIIPGARGEAAQVLNRAEAYKEKRIKESQGDVAKFLELNSKYALGKEVTKTRMYLETMQKVMPKVQKIIVDPSLKGSFINILGGGKVNEKTNN